MISDDREQVYDDLMNFVLDFIKQHYGFYVCKIQSKGEYPIYTLQKWDTNSSEITFTITGSPFSKLTSFNPSFYLFLKTKTKTSEFRVWASMTGDLAVAENDASLIYYGGDVIFDNVSDLGLHLEKFFSILDNKPLRGIPPAEFFADT